MSPEPKKRSEAPSQVSRNVAFASGAVIALLVGYLTLAALGDRAPAVITSEIIQGEAWTGDGSAYVPVDVQNEGGQTVSAVEIETTFEVEGGEPLVKVTQIDFLAGGERARFYAVGPAGAPLTARVIGFQEP